MIPTCYWGCSPRTDNAKNSPFSRDQSERPLGITVHAPIQDSPEEMNALVLIRELLPLEGMFKYGDSVPGSPRHLVFNSEPRPPFGLCSAEIASKDLRSSASTEDPRFWLEQRRIAFPESPAVSLEDIAMLMAHEGFGHDLFVTTSPILLTVRQQQPFKQFNICSPLEALRLIGLLLRHREKYVVGGPPHVYLLDAHTFYMTMLRLKAPRLWKCARGATGTDKQLEHVVSLRGSLIARCRRALEARDAIGVQFHRLASWRTAERMLYHFDYLTLLLTGAFDAAARIAHAVYGVRHPDLIRASFWKKPFNDALEKQGATRLVEVARSQEVQALHALLPTLRNTIHEVALGAIQFQATDVPQRSLAKFVGDGERMRGKVAQMGGAEAWGLIELGGAVHFEPYTYACRLVDVSLDALGRVHEAIDLERVLGVNAFAPDSLPTSEEYSKALRTPTELLARAGMLG